jgi:hypothetical protein
VLNRINHPGKKKSNVRSPSVSEETRLHSESVAIFKLSAADRRSMFEIFSRHYDCVTWERFHHDLEEKNCAIVLRDARGEICGFSTQKIMRAVVEGVPVKAVFSGDTIVDRRCWGDQELGKAWCRYVAALYAEEPETRLFWFLISKGFRTYLYLPLFFHDFYPRWNAAAPEFEQQVLNTLASLKFGEQYHPESGLITFANSQGQLKPELAVVPQRRLDHPHVRFFLERNPTYALGSELACLAEISPCNMKLFAGRIMNLYHPTAQALNGGD